MRRTLTGVDVDRETAVAELGALVAALKENRAHIQEIDHEKSATVEDTATERVSVEYVLTDDFDGIDPIQYPDRRGDD